MSDRLQSVIEWVATFVTVILAYLTLGVVTSTWE